MVCYKTKLEDAFALYTKSMSDEQVKAMAERMQEAFVYYDKIRKETSDKHWSAYGGLEGMTNWDYCDGYDDLYSYYSDECDFYEEVLERDFPYEQKEEVLYRWLNFDKKQWGGSVSFFCAGYIFEVITKERFLQGTFY